MLQFTQELKDQWVAALRSGEFQPTTGTLKRVERGGAEGETVGHCCLGVLAEIMGTEQKVSEDNDVMFVFRDLPPFAEGYLDSNRIEEDGSELRGGYLPNRFMNQWEQDSLAAMNDNGSTFGEIADAIEEKSLKDFIPSEVVVKR